MNAKYLIRKDLSALVPQYPSNFYHKKSAFTLAEGATHVAHWKDSRKVAFTLAEVLITLGIIGIVAALTLPTIIHKYQAKVLKTQFLQANTILQDGILRMRNDDVDLSDVINGRKIGIVKEYFAGGNCNLPKNV